MKKRHRVHVEHVASCKPGSAVVFKKPLTEAKRQFQQVERMNKLKLVKERI